MTKQTLSISAGVLAQWERSRAEDNAYRAQGLAKPELSSEQHALARFESWFHSHGHWLYRRERALEVWRTRGIEGLPEAPVGTPEYWRALATKNSHTSGGSNE